MANLNFAIKLGLAADGLKSGLSQAQNSLKGFASSVKSAMGMIAGAFAAGQIKAFSQECLQAYSAQMQAEQKLSVVMKQRMSATDAEVKSILKLTSAQQKQGVIGDEVQLAGAQQVATFLKQKDSLNALIPAMNNLLAQQKGLNATQGDAVNIGNLMGKVMTGQTSALKRVGITFDEAQEKILKYGTESEKAATLAQVITDNVGNMNSALAQTDMGKIQQMNNILGDLKEQIGGAIAPIVAELAPSIANIAKNMANGITNAITTIKANIQALVGFIAMQIASIGIVKAIMSAVTYFKTASASIKAEANSASAQLQAYDEMVLNKKVKIENMKLAAAKKGLTEESAFYEKIKNEETALAELTARRETVAANEAKAQQKLAAYETGNAWKKGMMIAKMASVTFITTVKGLFRSFAPLLIFEAVFTIGMKVYDMLMKNSGGFRKLASIVGGVAFKAISALADALGWVFDKLSAILGLEDKGSSSGSGSSSGKSAKDKIAEARRRAGRDPETGAYVGSGNSGGGTTPKTTKTKGKTTTKTPAEQAAEDVKKANEDYALAIKKAQNDTLNASEAQAKGLDAMKQLYDAYLKAYSVTGDAGYKAKMDELIPQIEGLSMSVEGAKEAADAMKKAEEDASAKLEEQAKARGEYKAAVAKIDSSTRDTTFDYKSTDNEKVTAQLDFDLSIAKQKLEEAKKFAETKAADAIDEVNKAEAKVTNLEDALKLQKVKEDIESLQEQIASADFSAMQTGWQAVEGTVSNINSLVETLNDPDASGWEKFAAVVNTVMSLFQTFQGIYEAFNTVQQLSTALTEAQATATGMSAEAKMVDTTATGVDSAANETDAVTTELNTEAKMLSATATNMDGVATQTDATATAEDAVAKGTDAAATGTLAATNTTNAAAATADATAEGVDAVASETAATAKGSEALSNSVNQGAKMPFPMNIVAIAMGAAAVISALAMVFKASKGGIAGYSKGGIPRFTSGGMVGGMQPNGDFINARLNSGEMVLNKAQQSRLFNIANGASNSTGAGGSATSVVRGEQLVSVINAYGKRTGRGEILKNS